jgi:hypothetical protein
MAALLKFGEQVTAKVPTPAQMLESADPKQRLAAVPIVRAMPPKDGVPLLRRLVADPDREVRRAGVDAIAGVATTDKDEAIRLYKPLARDADPVVRAKAQGKLAELVAPPKPTTTAVAAPTPVPPPPTPATDDPLPKLREAAARMAAAAAAGAPATRDIKQLGEELATTTAGTGKPDATTLKRVEELARSIDKAAAELEAVAEKIGTDAKAVVADAGARPSPEARKLVDQANGHAAAAREAAEAARTKARDAGEQAAKFKAQWAGDPQTLIAGANAAIAAGDFGDARRKLDEATKLLRERRQTNPNLQYSYGRLYDKQAAQTKDPAAQRKLLQQAVKAYRGFAKAGKGANVQQATGRAEELEDKLKRLGAP